jgi:hypothetical protein
MTLRYAAGAVAVVMMSTLIGWAQTPPDAPPPPLVIGRDPTELGEVIGKQFQIRAWVSEIGGVGMQKIYIVRLGPDGNVTIPGFPPQHAEGMSIGALEAQILAPIKPVNPKANVWISITDRTPPATQPTTQAATQPTTQPVAHAATQPATQPLAHATTQPAATQPVAQAATQPAATQPVASTVPQPSTHPVVASATTKPAASKP